MQHIIGVGIGGVVTYLLLVVTVGGASADKFLLPIVVGAIVALLWPWVIGLFLVRRVKSKRDQEIQDEVERQMAAKH